MSTKINSSNKSLHTDNNNDNDNPDQIDTLQKAYDYLMVETFNLASYPIGEVILLIEPAPSNSHVKSSIEFSTFLNGLSCATVQQDFLLYLHLRSSCVLDMKLDYCRIVFPNLSKDFESQICLNGVEQRFKFLL